jgi:ferredoxin-nitrite reductase
MVHEYPKAPLLGSQPAGRVSRCPADRIIAGLIERNMSSYQSGMDSVRNLTGSPIAGLDPHELLDTRCAVRHVASDCP